MNRARERAPAAAIGIDVGGTKIAAGVVEAHSGRLRGRVELPTRPERGGEAVLFDCAALARELGGGELPVGVGLCELVDLNGGAASADTVDRRHLDGARAFAASRVVLESDVRAAARAEAAFGEGAGRSPFLYAIVGTGASVCLVVDGRPFTGARGCAITLGAPPVERIASGPALARRAIVRAVRGRTRRRGPGRRESALPSAASRERVRGCRGPCDTSTKRSASF